MFESGVRFIGADPEVFLFNGSQPISAEGLIGGTKNDPIPMEDLGIGFFKQEDNVAAEFNIPPAATVNEFDINVAKAFRHIVKQVKGFNLSVKCVSAAHFSEEDLATPHAKELGCDPDFCAWTGEVNPRPVPPKSLRTAAGHVHVSWDAPDDAERILLAKYLDLRLTIPSLLVSEKSDRRKLYGRAGCFRPKSYGVEYRTLDNFWVPVKAYRRHIFNTIHTSVSQLRNNNNMWIDELEEWGDEIQNIINSHDLDGALQMIAMYDLPTFP